MSRLVVTMTLGGSLLLAGAAAAHPGHGTESGLSHYLTDPFHLVTGVFIVAFGVFFVGLGRRVARGSRRRNESPAVNWGPRGPEDGHCARGTCEG